MNDDIKNNLSDEMKSFVDNYRTALGEQYTADTNALANQRNIDHTTIMSGANRSGLLHSSFPGIRKLKYDVGNYDPSSIKLQQSYQTGLDKLYSNIGNYYNQIKSYKEAIADLASA